MSGFGEFLKSTIIGGLLIILPLGLVIVISMKFLGMLRPVAEPIAEFLPPSLRFPIVIAVVLLLGLSFAAGLIAMTQTGRRAGRFIEDTTLNRIPGYDAVRSLTHRIVDVEDTGKYAPAFVEIEDALVLAFIIEAHDDGRYTVFVPSSPTPAAGSMYVLSSDRVHLVDAPFMDAVKCVSRFGLGSAELLKAMRTDNSTKP